MIRALNRELGIPFEALMAEPRVKKARAGRRSRAA
jgi:hypothetical protein